MIRTWMLSFAASGLTAFAVQAQTVDRQIKDWTVFTHDGLCYIGSTPQNAAKDGKAYLLVTNRAASVDEVSAAIGTPYKSGADVTIITGKGGDHKLFSQDDMAWAKDAATDRQIVDAFKKSGNLRIKALDANDKPVEQKYSLAGFSTAYKRMKELCK